MIDQTQRAWCHAVSHMFPSEAEPCFETPELLEKYWAGRKWGMNSEMGQLRMVMLHRPDEEINTIDENKCQHCKHCIAKFYNGCIMCDVLSSRKGTQ